MQSDWLDDIYGFPESNLEIWCQSWAFWVKTELHTIEVHYAWPSNFLKHQGFTVNLTGIETPPYNLPLAYLW